jgi:hypothetical protein
MSSKFQALLLTALFGIAVASFDYVAKYHQQIRHQDLAAVIEANAAAQPGLGARTKETDCQVRGPLPDPDCTPGAVFAEATPDIICVSGYTKTVRDVSVSLKKKVYTEYGLAYPQARGTYEADHLIPLELGGNNDIANLFPEVDEPRPGYHEKDLVENYLNHEVCAGRLSLAAAQQQVAKDWTVVYHGLTPDQITELLEEIKKYY